MNPKKTVLVTGGTGFVGVHIILQLLQKGYDVNTTLRSLNRKTEILNALRDGGITDFKNLSFYEADLTNDAGWQEAVNGCAYVLHVASPFPLIQPEDENELIIPARDGALRVLKAARNAGVKRIVFTSSFAAVGYSNKTKDYVFSESDWTDENAPLQPYIKSKTIAEKAAWNFIKNEGNGLELTVINPVGIFGQILGDIYPASYNGVIEALTKGDVKDTPAFTFGVVDVRDVADLHIKAMLQPKAKGQRFLATSDGVVSFYDIAQLIKKERPEKAADIAPLQPISNDYYIKISNEKARKILDWEPRSKEDAILSSVDTGLK